MGNALFYLMTGDHLKAEDAFRIGLVQLVVDPEELIEQALEIGKKIASKGPAAIGKVKKVARKGISLHLDEGSELETKEFGSLFGNEGTEGMKAFLEKRKPEWNEVSSKINTNGICKKIIKCFYSRSCRKDG